MELECADVMPASQGRQLGSGAAHLASLPSS